MSYSSTLGSAVPIYGPNPFTGYNYPDLVIQVPALPGPGKSLSDATNDALMDMQQTDFYKWASAQRRAGLNDSVWHYYNVFLPEVARADEAARATGYAPFSDTPYMPPDPLTPEIIAAFWKNPPLTVMHYMVGAHIDFFTIFLKRLIKRTGRRSLTIPVPGPPENFSVGTLFKLRGNMLTLDLVPRSYDSLATLSLKVLGWLFCCIGTVLFELTRMILAMPVGKMGPLGAAPAAPAAGGGASGPIAAEESPKVLAEKAGKSFNLWGVIKSMGPAILRSFATMIFCKEGEPEEGSFSESFCPSTGNAAQDAAIQEALKDTDAFVAGSGSGSSSFPWVPVSAAIFVAVSLAGLLYARSK